MHRKPVRDDDRVSIREFFRHWGDLVCEVDFKNARELYTEDVIAFGSLGKMMTTRAALEASSGVPCGRRSRTTATIRTPWRSLSHPTD